MASTVIPWTTGSGSVTIAYGGNGDGSVTVSSDANEGLDRDIQVTVATTEGTPIVTESVTVRQAGLREVFNSSDTEFLVSDGTTFNVLKA